MVSQAKNRLASGADGTGGVSITCGLGAGTAGCFKTSGDFADSLAVYCGSLNALD
jgi:hypothetical protein